MSVVSLLTVASLFSTAVAADGGPERRALAYLSREVPRWATDNKCYSCHNNGDAARALYVAVRQSHSVPAEALTDTTRWLSRPEQWDKYAGDTPGNDPVLARIQFAAALVEAIDAGLVKDRAPLKRAADQVARHQEKDGSWAVLAAGTTGSPTTYGNCLATYVARRTLNRADPQHYQEAVRRADQWFRMVRVESVLDAAAVLLALDGSDDSDAGAQRQRCLKLIRKGQGQDGGWGPYVNSAAEPFDTAMVVLALNPLQKQADVRLLVRRGRAFLLSMQRPDGSWPETTRPAGGESYAQRLSTSGWATLALLGSSR
jgi:hypothetical protein